MLRDLAQTASEQTEVVDETSTSLGQIAKMAYQASKENSWKPSIIISLCEDVVYKRKCISFNGDEG